MNETISKRNSFFSRRTKPCNKLTIAFGGFLSKACVRLLVNTYWLSCKDMSRSNICAVKNSLFLYSQDILLAFDNFNWTGCNLSNESRRSIPVSSYSSRVAQILYGSIGSSAPAFFEFILAEHQGRLNRFHYKRDWMMNLSQKQKSIFMCQTCLHGRNLPVPHGHQGLGNADLCFSFAWCKAEASHDTGARGKGTPCQHPSPWTTSLNR